MTFIRRRFPCERLTDVDGMLAAELAGHDAAIRPGMRVAIAVGSRGIAGLARLVAGVAAWVKARGGEPFIVPAMGSHGGATAEGQQAVLAGYGVTEAATGAPIRPSMAVVELPRGEAEVPVYYAEEAYRADGTILINRVKPHTSFTGRYESGLMKMMAIGLGKAPQARAIHALGVRGLREVMPQAAAQVLRHGNVLLGVAVVENAHDELMLLCAIPAAEIPAREPELLAIARHCQPALPVDELDLLIVDEIGKNISGLGMDTRVIGRLSIRGEAEPERPRIRLILARDLAEATRGNACGIGLADFVTRRLFEQVDLRATYANVLTTGFLERGKIPLIAETEADALAMAAAALGRESLDGTRIIRIANTLRLDALLVSPPVLAEVAGREGIEVAGEVDDIFAPWPA
ncbi:MAG: nickel pincer cofactor-dependent isomerase, group 22 [Armatimonadota bacterium]